ncbi:MAG: BON domain-containing protein [Acidobacteriota bacterium]|nr:BON domain-containing protein [Acidobacteriota bacterium]
MTLKRILLPFVLFLALITTAFAASKPVTDDFLIDTIRQKLAADPVVKGGAIDVVVKDGAVTLKGTVEEDRQKNKAEKIAKRVSGVRSVSNELKIAHP